MLFDLRSRGRRRTVQGVYLALAVLIAVGLIGVGAGAGNGLGGILNAFTGNGSTGGQKQVISQQEQQALKATQADPNNAQAWAQLLQARWTTAGQAPDYNASSNTFSAAGKQELSGAVNAWQRYLALVKTPDPSLAALAARAYVYLGQYTHAANAWEQETLASPDQAKGYECLAVSAYAGKETRIGDLAAAKAVSLLPQAQQLSTKQTLSQAKGSAQGAAQLAQQC